MARNKVQFQRGLSDVEFERLYGTEDKCCEALFSWRWPEGFARPACGGLAHCELAKITRLIVRRGARVATDGLSCFNGVADAGCTHEAIVTGSGRKAARHPAFKAVNTALGNIQERHRRHVPIRQQEARPAPARRFRVPLQPPL
jgi:ISXO2-like transposase domain/Transposase zinc-ribbon domain